jgi:hypothetical protein
MREALTQAGIENKTPITIAIGRQTGWDAAAHV